MSANAKRIHKLLEESESNQDVSLLEKAGQLLFIQATRNPFESSSASPNRPPIGASYRSILPLPRPPPPQPSHLPQVYDNLPVQLAPIQRPGSNSSGPLGHTPPDPPHHNGWHPQSPPTYYPSTDPAAYSLSNGPANFITLQTPPYHTSDLPMQINSCLESLAPPKAADIETSTNNDAPGAVSPFISKSTSVSPSIQSTLTVSEVALIYSIGLPGSQADLNRHRPDQSQPFSLIPEDERNRINRLICQEVLNILETKSNSHGPLPAANKRGYDEYAEDEVGQTVHGKEVSLPQKKSKKI